MMETNAFLEFTHYGFLSLVFNAEFFLCFNQRYSHVYFIIIDCKD